MKHRASFILAPFLAAWIIFSGAPVLPAAPLRAELRQATITVGQKAQLSGQAAAGARITVQVTGPAAVAPGNATADATGKFSLELGPFTAGGSYGLYVRAGIEQQLLVLEVREQATNAALTAASNAYTQTLERTASSMERALERLTRQVAQFPRGDSDIAKVERELPRLRTLYFEVHRVITGICTFTTPMVFDICEVQGIRAGVCTELTQFYTQQESVLRPAAEALDRESPEDEAQRTTDMCMRAVYAKAGFDALASVTKMLIGGVSGYILETLAANTGASALQWFSERFLEHLPNAARPLPATVEASIHTVHTDIEAAMPYVLEGEEANPWGSIISIIQGAVTMGLDGFMEHHCLTFQGRISGHVHVEARENGVPYYGLDNDWTANTTLTCARPTSDAPYPISGRVTGRFKNFKADNRLYILYPRALASKLFLVTPPSIIRQAAALFTGTLEGTVQAGNITLKFKSMQIDGLPGVESTLTAVVMPSGSPVPVVQNFKVSYQTGTYQLSRCFKNEGTSLPIETEIEGSEMRRRIKGTVTHELTKGQAYGKFTLKVDLCSGCPSSWKAEGY